MSFTVRNTHLGNEKRGGSAQAAEFYWGRKCLLPRIPQETPKGHVDSSWQSVTRLGKPLLSFIAGVHEWTAVLYPKHSVCRHWRQPVRDTYVLCGLSHTQLPFCPRGGGRSAQWTCGWLFFLKEALTCRLTSPFCDFCLFTGYKHCDKYLRLLLEREPLLQWA